MPTTHDLTSFLREHRDELTVVCRDGRIDVDFLGGEVMVGVEREVLREAFEDAEQRQRIN